MTKFCTYWDAMGVMYHMTLMATQYIHNLIISEEFYLSFIICLRF